LGSLKGGRYHEFTFHLQINTRRSLHTDLRKRSEGRASLARVVAGLDVGRSEKGYHTHQQHQIVLFLFHLIHFCDLIDRHIRRAPKHLQELAAQLPPRPREALSVGLHIQGQTSTSVHKVSGPTQKQTPHSGSPRGTRGRSSGDELQKFIHSGNWYGKAASQPPKLMSLDRHSLFAEPYFGLKAIDNEDGYEIFLKQLHLFFSSYHHSKPWTFRF